MRMVRMKSEVKRMKEKTNKALLSHAPETETIFSFSREWGCMQHRTETECLKLPSFSFFIQPKTDYTQAIDCRI